MSKNHKGFTVVEGLLVLIILGIVGGVGWYVNSSRQQTLSIYDQTANTGVQPDTTKIIALGDMACDPADPYFRVPDANHCNSKGVTGVVGQLKPDAILALGDLQYENGALDKFQQSYDRDWGKYKSITYPVPGNHEYNTPGAAGYFDYFNEGRAEGRAGETGKGYYSANIANWHIIALNSNCLNIGGCGQGSQQYEWLTNDLADSKSSCTMAFWHHPHFTSGKYAADKANAGLSSDFWNILLKNKADVVLNGHDHLYERFGPQDTAGSSDPMGIRQFTVGSGGKSHYTKSSNNSNSQKIVDNESGVLRLDLYAKAYKWQFVGITGNILDQGSGQCVL
jgi:3',5'-cyclic AMP phosphodiesterase CpdA